MLKFLLDKGVQLQATLCAYYSWARDKRYDDDEVGEVGAAALHAATGGGHLEIVKFLLDKGVQPPPPPGTASSVPTSSTEAAPGGAVEQQ